jgi:ParB family chromosome partitioning protein
MADKRPALGRGLSALIPDAPAAPPAASERALEVDIDLLRPNKFQPRTHMDDGRIEELSRSIRSNGVIQPIVVRKADSGYEIVAGARLSGPACSRCRSWSATFPTTSSLRRR